MTKFVCKNCVNEFTVEPDCDVCSRATNHSTDYYRKKPSSRMTKNEFRDKIATDFDLNLTGIEADKLADLAQEYAEQAVNRIVLEKKEVCGCENSELGYHMKDCDFEPYGYNTAVDNLEAKKKEVLAEIKERG